MLVCGCGLCVLCVMCVICVSDVCVGIEMGGKGECEGTAVSYTMMCSLPSFGLTGVSVVAEWLLVVLGLKESENCGNEQQELSSQYRARRR